MDGTDEHEVRGQGEGRISRFELRSARGQYKYWTKTLTMTITLYNLQLDNLQCTILRAAAYTSTSCTPVF